MDYKNIFENYGLIKNKINKLLSVIDRSYIKKELDNIKDIYLKKVVKCQYLYLLQKEMNLLENNKSQLIIQLEYNLKKIEKMENIKDIMKILNKLGYVDLLLLILNINKDLFEKIKNFTDNKSIEYSLLDINNLKNYEDYLDNLINKITNNVFDKFKNENSVSSNNVNIIYKDNKKIDKIITEEDNNEEEDEEIIINKSDILIDEEEDDKEEDVDEEEDDEEEDVDEEDEEDNKENEKKNKINLNIKNLIPTIIEKKENIEKDEKDEDGNKIKESISQKIILSQDDINLLGKL
tara:strand:- start:315 stop:1193 length:879 start_codon:yes stop_codon:yes gene_type:complete